MIFSIRPSLCEHPVFRKHLDKIVPRIIGMNRPVNKSNDALMQASCQIDEDMYCVYPPNAQQLPKTIHLSIILPFAALSLSTSPHKQTHRPCSYLLYYLALPSLFPLSPSPFHPESHSFDLPRLSSQSFANEHSIPLPCVFYTFSSWAYYSSPQQSWQVYLAQGTPLDPSSADPTGIPLVFVLWVAAMRSSSNLQRAIIAVVAVYSLRRLRRQLLQRLSQLLNRLQRRCLISRQYLSRPLRLQHRCLHSHQTLCQTSDRQPMHHLWLTPQLP